MKFEGTKSYISTEDLSMAVNAAINLERPLLIKGEPGTGKTMLALEVAESLGYPCMNGILNLLLKLNKDYMNTMQ